MKMNHLLVLLAALCLLAACKGRGNYEPINNEKAYAIQTDTAFTDTDSVKLVKTAQMSMKVKDIHRASENIVALTESYRGMVMHHDEQSTVDRTNDIRRNDDSIMRVSSFSTTASITVKIPSDSLEHFMTKVGKMGLYVNMRKMDIEDLTLDYLSNKLKLESRTQIISQQKKGKIIIKNPADVLALKDDMVDQKVTNLRTDAAAKNSVLELSLFANNTILKEIIPNDDPTVYRAPLLSRLGFALANGWNLFADIIIGLTNLWVFFLIGALAWIGYRAYKRRKQVGLSNI
ncbi:DUF4349 domain-containing protein [Mucilaginibacter sp. Bleaf8]|uniref:DUF4349 domain-containing protein n=1 Tax=Mucilaginibacter sp. Bleaf8 TaxID=2834430 RepID=UPI001BCBC658|nr:DUF4349 domain-containing protein [Mucilaginibacter sp. Bleaf8]MBS7564310.1 DUF4349 domain-containing protein [Mucilaginibacter sp. Bleaf8]